MANPRGSCSVGTLPIGVRVPRAGSMRKAASVLEVRSEA